MEFQTYREILNNKEQQLAAVSKDPIKLGELHEETLKSVLHVAIANIALLHGPPPSSFSFFVMGSAARGEQSIWSDQDHGIIYEEQNGHLMDYFYKLGQEISKGLFTVGYEYCDGNVMAINPLWCKSLSDWKEQLHQWIHEASWESIRHLLIFMDARSVYGEENYVTSLKEWAFQEINQEHLLKKIVSNTMYHKKGISVLGKIITETHGPFSGALNIKETAILPFVNAARLLAIKAGSQAVSTLSRLEYLSDSKFSDLSKKQFLKLLHFRLRFGSHTNYEAGHYLPIPSLSKEQKKELKEAIKHGEALTHFVIRLIEKDDSLG
jgi:CBS domain-containing protein